MYFLSVRGVSVFVAVVSSVLLVRCQNSYEVALRDTTELLNNLGNANVTAGVAQVVKGGQTVFYGGFGRVNQELNVNFTEDMSQLIGSNTKFYTAVAIYQLQDLGLLSVNDTVNQYLDKDDLGFSTDTWCPLIYQRQDEGCQYPTIKNLLEMSSGILPSDNLACGAGDPQWALDGSDWRWQHSIYQQSHKLLDYISDQYSRSIPAALRFYNILDAPLQSAPGEAYCYTNVNFVLAAYILEKVTNMTYGEYLEANIFAPANLTRTIYWSGYWGQQPNGLAKNQATRSGYQATFTNGDSGPVFDYVIHVDPSSFQFQLAGPSGALESTVDDLVKFYFTVFSTPEVLGLSANSVEALLAPNTLIPGNSISGSQLPEDDKVYFSQGTSVVYVGSRVKQIQYVGSFGGFKAAITFFYNSQDPSKSDVAAFFTNYAASIPAETNGTCSVAYGGQKLDLDSRLCAAPPADELEEGSTLQPIVATPVIMDQLYSIWNITGDYSSA